MGMKRRRAWPPPAKLRWETDFLKAQLDCCVVQIARKRLGWRFRVWQPLVIGGAYELVFTSKDLRTLPEAKRAAQGYYESGLADGTIWRMK